MTSHHAWIADSFFITSGMTLLAKWFTCQDAKGAKASFLVVICSVAPLAALISLNHYLNTTSRLKIVIDSAVTWALLHRVSDLEGGKGKCLENISQGYWLFVRNNSDRVISIDHLTIEVKLEGQATSWTASHIVVPIDADNMYYMLPVIDSIGSKREFVVRKARLPLLAERLQLGIQPGDEVSGWIMSTPEGPGPTVQDIYTPSYHVAAVRVSAIDSSGESYITEKHEWPKDTRPGSDIKMTSLQLTPVAAETAKWINSLPPCR